jgi:hypothetical protein
MQFSEKRALSLLAGTFALISGLTISPSFTQSGSAYAASSGTTPSVTASYTRCMPDLEDDLEATDASYDVTDGDSLEDLDEGDALDWQAEYMFNFSEYALCVGRSTAGHDLPVDEDDLVASDYTRLAHVGVMLYLLTDEEALQKMGIVPTPIDSNTAASRSTTKSTTATTKAITKTKSTSDKSTSRSDDTSTPGKKDGFTKTPLGKFLLCVAELFGAVSIWEIINELKKQGIPNPRDCMRNAWCRKKVLKILKKWASRLLGFWGVALILVDLGICAYLYATDDG